MNLSSFRTLGRSGLIVSPLALGTMTFGNASWGSADEVSRDIFNAYVDAGGNFIDTADVYGKGRSEELVGSYVAERGLRDRLVLATKSSFHFGEPGNANAGGNGRKHMQRALEGSLKRLGTDYIDLYWMHVWDRVTPVEEVLQSLGDMVRAGKIRYFGFSDVPAWYAAKAATLASVHGVPGPIALQLEYSLVERSIEREHLPAARECGLGICPWSPLAGGFLAGKYEREAADATANASLGASGGTGLGPKGEGRLTAWKGFKTLSDRHWRVLDAVRTVAAKINRPMAQVALAWACAQPGITSPILGASQSAHLDDNLAALDIVFPPEQLKTLNDASALETVFPYNIFTDEVNRMVFGGTTVKGW